MREQWVITLFGFETGYLSTMKKLKIKGTINDGGKYDVLNPPAPPRHDDFTDIIQSVINRKAALRLRNKPEQQIKYVFDLLREC